MPKHCREEKVYWLEEVGGDRAEVWKLKGLPLTRLRWSLTIGFSVLMDLTCRHSSCFEVEWLYSLWSV